MNFDPSAAAVVRPSTPHQSRGSVGSTRYFGNLDDGQMQIRKRDGSMEPVDVIQITKKVARCGAGLEHINPYLIASKAISGIYDGVSTTELDTLLMQTAAMLIGEEPEYSKLAARLLIDFIDDELIQLGVKNFSGSIQLGYEAGLICQETHEFVQKNATALNEAIRENHCDHFEYFGLKTVYDRYLLRHPSSRLVLESSQFFFMRVACGLSRNVKEARSFYKLISSFEYMPSTPTLFNSGTRHPQMSSCYLLDSPEDSLESIYNKYTDIAMLSKFAGGIGLSFSRVRCRDSLIRSTNGKSHGIIPFIKTLDSSVAAVNQGGKRKGAACVYLETWHSDLLDFLELRDNTGDESMRAHNLNFANWVPDLFMQRVEDGEMWSFFDPKEVADLPDLFGSEFEKRYLFYEKQGLAQKQVPARDVYAKMMRTLAHTGNGWMTFKDASNKKGNQTKNAEQVIHLSNLCTEIVEVTNSEETAVCNLGSLNLSRYVKVRGKAMDFEKLGRNVRLAVKFLDRVVDINFYPTSSSRTSNHRWRPVGLGIMGLQDVFFKLRMPFDSEEARQLSRSISEEIYYHALSASCDLAEELGAHDGFEGTRAAAGDLQFDLWDAEPGDGERWQELKERIKKHGLRNSLIIAIAPTATIASITGVYECIEPQVSNLFKRETLSGEFLQINSYLVKELRKLGLWTAEMKNAIKARNGSVQDIEGVPDALKATFRTAWEIPQKSLIEMAADRGAFVDQSQSLNLFMESPTIGKLSSMYIYAWKQGLKTTYYLRSRGATQIRKTTTTAGAPAVVEGATRVAGGEDAMAVSCSLENPDQCEACT